MFGWSVVVVIIYGSVDCSALRLCANWRCGWMVSKPTHRCSRAPDAGTRRQIAMADRGMFRTLGLASRARVLSVHASSPFVARRRPGLAVSCSQSFTLNVDFCNSIAKRCPICKVRPRQCSQREVKAWYKKSVRTVSALHTEHACSSFPGPQTMPVVHSHCGDQAE